jgi:hypothetical protein
MHDVMRASDYSRNAKDAGPPLGRLHQENQPVRRIQGRNMLNVISAIVLIVTSALLVRISWPCGCGAPIMLSLSAKRRPRWTFSR